jgi:hypothetical protein
MAGYWYDRAAQVIKGAIEAAHTEGVTDAKEIQRRVDAAYPFGAREHFPYKAWLKARRDLIGGRAHKPNEASGIMRKLAAWENGERIGSGQEKA